LYAALEEANALNDRLSMLIILVGLARLAIVGKRVAEAAQLCGASEALADAIGSGYLATRMWPPDRERFVELQVDLQAHRANPVVYAALAGGHMLTVAEVVELALSWR
jgi:hypothetical protein